MDMWLFYEATHRRHLYCNPISEAGVRDLGRILELKPGMRVLDIACGHAEMLIGFAERYGIRGRRRGSLALRQPARRENVEGRASPRRDLGCLDVRGAEGRASRGHGDALRRRDVHRRVLDLGGLGGDADALLGVRAARRARRDAESRTGGTEPPAAYLEAEELTADEFPTLDGYAEVARGLGLTPLWMRGASEQEWDRYEMDQLAAFDALRQREPGPPRPRGDPRRSSWRRRTPTVRWGRDGFGFAIWVFRTPA